MTKKIKGVRVVFTPEEYKEKGFDGEIGQYMFHHKNTAIIGSGDERHVIEFDNHECFYTGDDSEAFRLVVSYFDEELAGTVKRKQVSCY